ncbi:MFS transporter [Reyranella sp.]|uniref:MFS transporter n=1 Tax=Reyranella sp. TaxID=1929291 RepID=UPI003C7D6275
MKLVLTAFLPFALGYFLSFLFRSLNAVVAPALRGELGLDDAAIGVVTSMYLAAFVVAQLPAGVALDRFGPRRVAPVMLLATALGAVVFAVGQDVVTLSIGRALIGLGLSVALMCGFKANVLYWPIGRLPLVNAVMMTFGGLGAAMATRPVQWLLVDFDWREVFLGLAAITVAVAIYQLLAAPGYERGGKSRLRDELRGLAGVLKSRVFWSAGLAPTFSLGVWICYASFWAAGWLRDVAHLDEPSVGVALFALSIAIVPGYFFSGVIVDLLHKRGIRGGRVLLVYGMLFLAIHIPIALNITAAPKLLWFAYVMFGGMPVVCYALVTRAFAPALAGRVNTTLNLVCMLIAFVLQAAIGPALAWMEETQGLPRAQAHQIVTLAVLAMQAALWLWFASSREARDLP